MKLNIDKFDAQGYLHLEDVIPEQPLRVARRDCINLKKEYINKLGEPRDSGTGVVWRGLEMASMLNENLLTCYVHPFMEQIATSFFKTPHLCLFNDQAVVKLPGEDFAFPEHYDNQYSPDLEGVKNGEFRTINFMWVLTNCEADSGPIEVLNNNTNEWDTIIAKAGDMIVIDGNTLHRSGHNKTNKIRAMYACVYSTKRIGKTYKNEDHPLPNFKYFYNRPWRFCKGCADNYKNYKLNKKDNSHWLQYLSDNERKFLSDVIGKKKTE